MAKRPSPRVCPKCGSCAVEKIDGLMTCKRDGCGHQAKTFPTLMALSRQAPNTITPHGSAKGMASGCFMVRPSGNKYS